MPAPRAPATLDGLARLAAAWPPLLRDLGAAGLAVLSVCLGELAVLALPLPAEAMLAAPGVLLAWLVLGWPSAVFGALVAAAVVAVLSPGDRAGLAPVEAHEPLKLAALSAGFVAACLGARLWARRRAARAERLMDACAHDALRRIAAAEAEAQAASRALRRAEAELTEARRAFAACSAEAALEAARRAEGGI